MSDKKYWPDDVCNLVQESIRFINLRWNLFVFRKSKNRLDIFEHSRYFQGAKFISSNQLDSHIQGILIQNYAKSSLVRVMLYLDIPYDAKPWAWDYQI